jgi:trimeric autotransporter adhesin
MFNITTGRGNVAVGYLAAYSLEGGSGDGKNNVAIGREALEGQVTQEDNIAIGFQALTAGNSTSNSQNTIVGSQAGAAAHAGYGNCYFGYTAGAANTSGIHNCNYGRAAGSVITSGGNNVCIGYEAGTSSSPSTITTGSNGIVLGNNSTATAHIKVAWTVTSDSRDKTEVADLDLGLNFINSLAPKTYKWDMRSDYNKDLSITPDGTYKKPQVVAGLLAQDVEILERAAGYKVEEQTNIIVSKDEKGNYGLQYEKLIPILINALQEADDKIDALIARVATLEG